MGKIVVQGPWPRITIIVYICTVDIADRASTETDRSLADISKIKEQLNWHQTITIEEGIEILFKNTISSY